MASRLAPIALCVLLCACQPVVKVDVCQGWQPIYPSRQDVLTDGTAKQVLAHDQYGLKMGCWKIPKKNPSK
jgi:hypothetical protein